ncbi:MAG: XisI protein [Anaerolineae bacterium]|nr:XisI protein [Anaerolineae bacterium]
MVNLKDTVRQVTSEYAGEALNGYTYLTHSDDGSVFTVVGVGTVQGKHVANISLFVRIVGDKVIVERDQNDKPLVDALIQAGVPREQIILAYAGESVPEMA